MFLGQYHHTLDEKGRLTIPAAFRNDLGDGAFVTQGFERNLMVMTKSYFEAVYGRLSSMNITNEDTRFLKRLVLSNAYGVEVDKAGRILVPNKLREFLALGSEAALVGTGEYFEIWNPTDWEGQLETLQNVKANSQRFAMLDLSTGK